MSSLPVIGWVAFKLDDKYVRHTREDGQFNNALTASGDQALTPYTMFYLEPSAKYKGLVHIRSCYNNKYWVPKKIKDSWYIFVDAKEPQDDKTQSSCTLFEFPANEGNKIAPCASIFKHVVEPKVKELGYKIEYPRGFLGRSDEGCLFVTGCLSALSFGVITLDEDKALPIYVRFKGDNDKYLGSDGAGQVLRFAWTDGNCSSVIHSIHTSPDASFIRIKSEKSGKFWRREHSGNWICPDTDNDQDVDTWFEVVRCRERGNNVIALKNKGNGKFVKRLTEYYTDGYDAYIDSAELEAQLKVEEAVVSRKIYNVQYHMDAARIYDQKTLVMATAHSVNSTSTETTAKLNLKYSVAKTSSWSKTTTETWGVNSSFRAGLPAISFGFEGFELGITPDLSFSEERNYEHAFTEEHVGTQTHTEEQSVDYEMKVPPRTKMTLRAITSQISYDIPYSYIQKDVLADGRRIVTQGEDGLFQGVSCHEFTYEVNEEKLTGDAKATE